MSSLFYEDTVFVSSGESQESVFREVADSLLKKGYVTEEYIFNLIEREKKYPTALPLQPVDPSLPNIAIPHTESEYVNVTRVVPVKLLQPIPFHNMILPEEELAVSFLFMILNNDESEQAGLLAGIMDFINRQDVEQLQGFFELEDAQQIYQFLNENY